MKTLTLKNRKIAVLSSIPLVMGALVAGQAQAGAMKADFNGDGYEDMVVGVTGERLDTVYNAGAVKVVYGRADGTWRPHAKTTFIHQGRYGVDGLSLGDPAESGDRVGSRLAVGDFNNDGYDDLATGVPYESVNGKYNMAGLVHIVYGSSAGLTRTGQHTLSLLRFQNGTYRNIAKQFGNGMAVGDYDNDGIDDLAIGFLGVKTSEADHDGGAAVFFGDANKGLKYAEYAAKTYIATPHRELKSTAKFGWALTSGDYDDDGYEDLAVSSPYEKLAEGREGRVRIFFGNSDWHASRPKQSWVAAPARSGSGFGSVLASGNFNATTRDEVVIGMPNSNYSGHHNAGMVSIANVYLDYRMGQVVRYQRLHSLPGSSEPNDRFGSALTVADFDGNGHDDLAIGIPNKKAGATLTDWDGYKSAGEVMVLYGNGRGLERPKIWHQDSSGVEGGREDHDFFGRALSSGDFNNDGKADLLVGASGEDIGSIYDAGSVQFIWGHRNGLTASLPGKQLYHQGNFNGEGFGSNENERSDRFGGALLP